MRFKSFGAVTHAELDAEIDAEPDKEHGEGNGDQVQGSHHPEPDSGGEDEPGRQVDKNGQDDPGLFQREPQHQHNKQKGDDAIQRGAVGNRGEFLV